MINESLGANMRDVTYGNPAKAILDDWRHHMVIFLSLLVAIIGLLIYALATNGKVVEIGKIMFWTGLLAFLLTVTSASVHLLR
jgi:hypothetical protein